MRGAPSGRERQSGSDTVSEQSRRRCAEVVRDRRPLCHNARLMKFLRMKPGHGEVVLTEGDPALAEDEERLVAAFREQLDQGMWAAVPEAAAGGRRGARMVKAYSDIPTDAERVIFFPRAAGGC